MRVLIAEDEYIERKAMRKFIEENFTDIYVVGEAINGRKAIKQSQELKPDVILMDIKMPGIGGLEAIKQIHEHDTSIKFIMISAYDSFDYAKQAMNYGIKDYILKPGKKEEIVKALLRMKNEIKSKQEQQVEQRKSDELLKERFVSRLMQSPLQKDVGQLKVNLFPAMKSSFFLVLMSEITFDLERIKITIQKVVDYPFVLLEKENHLIIYVAANHKLKSEDILAIAQKLQFNIDQSMFIGAGLPYADLKKIQRSYHEAYTNCFQLKTNDQRKYGFLKEADQKTEEIIIHIYDCIDKGNGNEAALLYDENKQNFLTKDYDDLYIKIKELLGRYHIVMPDSSISALRTDRDWHHFITMCGMKVNDFYQSKQFMAQIKTFIQEHYEETVSLEDAASRMDLSPNYFSNLFKQQLGVTFTDYVATIRMDKAKELIKENIYTLKEISYKVGYNNPNYFSRVFKKHHNLSPKQYKQQIFKK